jgi:hypothetical protein
MSDKTPVLLTGYDAKRCARRVHNEWDPSIEKVAWEIPGDLQMRFNAGIEFEAAVFAQLRSSRADHQYIDALPRDRRTRRSTSAPTAITASRQPKARSFGPTRIVWDRGVGDPSRRWTRRPATPCGSRP